MYGRMCGVAGLDGVSGKLAFHRQDKKSDFQLLQLHQKGYLNIVNKDTWVMTPNAFPISGSLSKTHQPGFVQGKLLRFISGGVALSWCKK